MSFSVLKGLVLSIALVVPIFTGIGGAMEGPEPYFQNEEAFDEEFEFGWNDFEDRDHSTATYEESTHDDVAIDDREELYQNSCAACHANDLKGGAGPSLTDVRDTYSQDEIKEIILNGMGAMPGGLVASEKEAEQIAAWLLEQ